MRHGHRWLSALLLAALAGGVAPGVEAQRTPERRAEREATRRGWIGISLRTLGERGPAPGGAVVEDVSPDSPAERAGLQPGDTLVRWNGRTDVGAALDERGVQPGDSVRLRVRRGGRDRDVVAVAAERPPRVALLSPGRLEELRLLVPGEFPRELRLRMDSLRVHADSLHSQIRTMFRDSLGPRLRELERGSLPRVRLRVPEGDLPLAFDFELGLRAVAGAEFAEMNPGLADYFGTDEGALVLRVAPGTPAARAGLEAGDVVVSVDGERVESIRDLRRGVGDAQRREVELEVVRKGERREVRMRWER